MFRKDYTKLPLLNRNDNWLASSLVCVPAPPHSSLELCYYATGVAVLEYPIFAQMPRLYEETHN